MFVAIALTKDAKKQITALKLPGGPWFLEVLHLWGCVGASRGRSPACRCVLDSEGRNRTPAVFSSFSRCSLITVFQVQSSLNSDWFYLQSNLPVFCCSTRGSHKAKESWTQDLGPLGLFSANITNIWQFSTWPPTFKDSWCLYSLGHLLPV